MLYQLPSGKVINISVEEFLSMSDQELQDLSAGNLGYYTTSPWDGSAIKNNKKVKKSSNIDKSLDYTEDSDEIIIHSTTISIITIDDVISYEQEDDNASEEADDT